MYQPLLEKGESATTSSATPPLEKDPSEFRRVTRTQTRAAREEMRRRMEASVEVPEEPVILPTRYPIRRQPISAESTKPSGRNVKPPVTPCEDVQQIAPVARTRRGTRSRRTQTSNDYIVTENEMKLLKSLRAKRIDVEKVKIVTSRREHVLIPDDGTDTEIEEIDLTARRRSPLLQMPMRQRSPRYSPPSISSTMLCHDMARLCDTDPLQDLHWMSNNPLNFFHNAAHFLNSHLHNNVPNLNHYGLPRWCPKPDFYALHAPWGA